MSVVHLVSYFPPDRVGGVGEVVSKVHASLLRRGHRSTVVTTGTTHRDDKVRRVGAQVGRYAFSSISGIRHALNADVVHAHHGEAMLLLLALRIRRQRPILVLTLHGSTRQLGRASLEGVSLGGRLATRIRGTIKFLFDRLASRMADEVTYISSTAAIDVVGSSTDTTVVHNGIELGDEPELGRTRCEILFVGRPAAVKRIDRLPEVLALVREKGIDASLCIVGFHLDEAPEFKRQLESNGLLNVVTTNGAIPSSEIRGHYEGSGVLLLTSDYEGQPMVLLEAFAAGLPVVAGAVGGIPELVEHGTNGYLAPAENTADLADACARILKDPRLRANLGHNARQFATANFGVDAQIEGYLEVYERLMSTSGVDVGSSPAAIAEPR